MQPSYYPKAAVAKPMYLAYRAVGAAASRRRQGLRVHLTPKSWMFWRKGTKVAIATFQKGGRRVGAVLGRRDCRVESAVPSPALLGASGIVPELRVITVLCLRNAETSHHSQAPPFFTKAKVIQFHPHIHRPAPRSSSISSPARPRCPPLPPLRPLRFRCFEAT